MSPVQRGNLEVLSEWQGAEPAALDPTKLAVWIFATASSWVAVVAIALIVFSTVF
ncbi:MAG: hypothetical protein ACM30I_07480 [Gemmatimonas sp.]